MNKIMACPKCNKFWRVELIAWEQWSIKSLDGSWQNSPKPLNIEQITNLSLGMDIEVEFEREFKIEEYLVASNVPICPKDATELRKVYSE